MIKARRGRCLVTGSLLLLFFAFLAEASAGDDDGVAFALRLLVGEVRSSTSPFFKLAFGLGMLDFLIRGEPVIL